MLRFGSLRTRIIVLTTIPLIAILVTMLMSTMRTADTAVRKRVHESLTESGSVFVQLLTSRRNELVSMAQVTVRDPRFFAPFSIPPTERGAEFRPTLEGLCNDFLRITDADFIQIFDADGGFIAEVARDNRRTPGAPLVDDPAAMGRTGIETAMKGSAVADFYQAGDRIAAAAVAPVFVTHRLEAVVRFGTYLDDEFVGEVKRLTGADVCLARSGEAYASTFPGGHDDTDEWRSGGQVASTIGRGSVTLSEAFSRKHLGKEYLTIHVGVGGIDPRDGFDAFIGRELQAELAPIVALEKRLALGGGIAVLVTLLLGFAMANSITRPLSRMVQASVALQQGQYDYPIDMRGTDEVAILGRNFGHMRESLASYVSHLKSVDQAKSNFIALAGHELRTPLTIITGFNEMIASGALGSVPDKVRETTNLITEQLSGLNGLVQAMLDLTYFEQGLQSLRLVRCDVRELVREVSLARRESIEERKLHMTVDAGSEPLMVLGDPTRLRDALQALVDNAIRFTPDGGSVRVSAQMEDNHVRIVVEDTGIGIPQHELKWIFEKIYEVGDLMHHSSGTFGFGSKGFGLGLALCKAIVEAHGGSVTVVSSPGRGSAFTISIPGAGLISRTPVTAPEKAGTAA
jgi:signal transduction histidine kinase